jgi:SAM-dependent methyltransferase
MSKIHLGAHAGQVFDRLATTYDRDFTESLIGRAQRNAVWKEMLKVFHPQDNILELNCGTGEDAFFMASYGISVFACDASQQMILRAEQRLHHKSQSLPVVFCHLSTERIAELSPYRRFDGVFSNFSGLNCIEDLKPVATALSSLLHHNNRLLLCFSTRYCWSEFLYYTLRGEFRKAVRRWGGRTTAVLDGVPLTIYYPTVREICRSFAPHLRLSEQIGIGVAIPPSYMEPQIRSYPVLFRVLCKLEAMLARLPILRSIGDHVLLCFEKVAR